MKPSWTRKEGTWIVAFALVLLIVWVAYQPGLPGSFLFDDFINLPALGDFGPVDNWTTFIRYITSGDADPTGRPLALLSFLLDGRDWPTDPYPFKRTSVVLHLINGCLLARCMYQLGSFRLAKMHALCAAFVGAAIWLAHPLWISTTLYVVQREAMLPATFCFLGLSAYLSARRDLENKRTRRACWMFVLTAVCTVLAFLSKANGILLPCLIGILELAYLRRDSQPTEGGLWLRRYFRFFVVPVCVIVVVAVLQAGISGGVTGLPGRPWTEWQRIITEPRVLWDYLSLLFVPHPFSRGIFNDSFVVSTDLLHPWTTLPAMIGLVGLLIAAWKVRRTAPAVSTAILFYLVGHSTESTTFPLELYFEHRNYLPAAFAFWPLAIALTSPTGKHLFARLGASAAIFIVLCLETYAGASLWGDTQSLALVWARQNPDSPRAQSFAASAERADGRLDAAEARLRRALSAKPDEVQLAINLLGVRCDNGRVTEDDIHAAELALERGNNRGPLSFDWISQAILLAQRHACDGLDARVVDELISALEKNKLASTAAYRQQLANLHAQLALASDDLPTADTMFATALREDPKPDLALKQAAMLGAAGHPASGLAQLDLYEKLVPDRAAPRIHDMPSFHQWILFHDGYWTTEFSHLRGVLVGDLKADTRAQSNGQNPP